MACISPPCTEHGTVMACALSTWSTHIMIVQHGEDGGVMVGDHEAGTVEPLGLVDQHVAALVVGVIGHHHSTGHGQCGRVLGMQELQQLSCLGAWCCTHIQNLHDLD